jgi:2-keto-4-pentenoate hydratase/2-oxohepta-3-ene-1,7-dioic acid hydratase in catechol pathway
VFRRRFTTSSGRVERVLGRRAARIAERDVPSAVFGYVPVLDMTAEDILQRNPRFLTCAKSFAADVLLTGTPGAAVIEDGDDAACRIDGFAELRNPVRRPPPDH